MVSSAEIIMVTRALSDEEDVAVDLWDVESLELLQLMEFWLGMHVVVHININAANLDLLSSRGSVSGTANSTEAGVVLESIESDGRVSIEVVVACEVQVPAEWTRDGDFTLTSVSSAEHLC